MLTTQDFNSGVDFTGLPNVTGADLNNAVNLGTPHQESASEGKGLILVTKDTALSIPAVPDPTIPTKWKKYAWVRVPFAGATDLNPIVYCWNEDAPSDGVYLKWLQIKVDFTDLETAINAAVNLATIAKNEADQAIALAQAVNTVANTASTNANDALTAANSANAAATASAATANASKASADLATTNANAATAAAAAVTASLATYTSKHNTAILLEQAGNGVDLGGIAAGVNQRNINTEAYDGAGIVTLGGGKITITNAGTYVFDIVVPFVPDLTGANNQFCQAYLVKDSDSSILARGTSASFQFSGTAGINCSPTLYSHIKCCIVAAAGLVVRVDLKASAANGWLGKASSLGTNEDYTICRIDQIA